MCIRDSKKGKKGAHNLKCIYGTLKPQLRKPKIGKDRDILRTV